MAFINNNIAPEPLSLKRERTCPRHPSLEKDMSIEQKICRFTLHKMKCPHQSCPFSHQISNKYSDILEDDPLEIPYTAPESLVPRIIDTKMTDDVNVKKKSPHTTPI